MLDIIKIVENDNELNIDLIGDYDTPEQIYQCLHCEKEECNNCLRWINGV
jgi:uncharacterized protein (DUF433 family)